MPELPEVENILQGILPIVKGQIIKKVEPLGEKFSFLKNFEGKKILEPYRYGKYLIFPLVTGEDLVFQFRMTGKLVIRDEKQLEKHDLCLFLIRDKWLVFNSVRKFATIEVFPFSQKRKTLGPDILGEKFTVRYFKEALFKSKMPLKTFLLDQKKLAGLGNIYVCEALFCAGISPRRIAKEVKEKEAHLLHECIINILKTSIAKGGTTFSDYRKADNTKGSYQNYLKVFKREGLPCFNCGETIKRIKQSGRSTFYCPRCQK